MLGHGIDLPESSPPPRPPIRRAYFKLGIRLANKNRPVNYFLWIISLGEIGGNATFFQPCSGLHILTMIGLIRSGHCSTGCLILTFGTQAPVVLPVVIT